MPYSDFVPHYDNFPHKVFEEAVSRCTDDDILVEVGAFLGHGTCYMAECLAIADKRPKFYAIDLWDEPEVFCQGHKQRTLMPWGESLADWRARGGRLYDSFQFYTEGSPFTDRIFDYIQFPPASCMDEFEDNSVSFVYLGYNWQTETVMQEVEKWMKKLKPGGLLYIGPNEDTPARAIEKS